MPNVITLSGPTPTQQIVSQFLDQYNANRRADQRNALGRDELAQRTQAQSDTNAYQQGTLEDARKKLAQLETVYNDKQMQDDVEKVLARQGSYQDAINSLPPNDPQRTALETQAKAEMDAIIQAKPGIDTYLKIAGVKKVITPAYQEQLATQGVKTGAAQGMQGGNPTPMQADVFSKENFKQGMSPEMVKDLQSRQPEAAPAPPGQTASPVTDYYRGPALGVDTTAAQDQAAQTQIADTKLQGQAQRDVAGINAKSAMALQREKEATPAVAASVVQGVLTDPQSYYGLPIEDKKIVLRSIGRAPSKLSATEIDRVNAAKFGTQLIDDADEIVKKWQGQGRPITGPVLGRFNAAEGTWGDMIIPPDLPPEKQREYAQDVSKLREWLTALPIMEAKALAGGRTAYQVIEKVTAAAPSMSKGQDMFEGSVQGLRTRFAQIDDHLTKKQWGGKPPQGVGIVSDAPSAGAAPSPGGGIITTPDGLKWTKNPDGSMTQVP